MRKTEKEGEKTRDRKKKGRKATERSSIPQLISQMEATLVSHMGAKAQRPEPSFIALPGIPKGSWLGSGVVRSQTGAHMRGQICRRQLNLP